MICWYEHASWSIDPDNEHDTKTSTRLMSKIKDTGTPQAHTNIKTLLKRNMSNI